MTQVIYEGGDQARVSQKGGVAFLNIYACYVFDKIIGLLCGCVWECLDTTALRNNFPGFACWADFILS